MEKKKKKKKKKKNKKTSFESSFSLSVLNKTLTTNNAQLWISEV